MNVHNILSHPCAKFEMPKSKDEFAKSQNHGRNIILILRPMVKVTQGHECHFLIYSSAIYGMAMSKQKKAVVRTQSHVKTPINLTLGSKVNVLWGSCRDVRNIS